MNDNVKATVRTTVPVFWLTAIAGLITTVFDWKVTVEDLLPFSPFLAVGFGIVYRISRILETKWPSVGYVLFGSKGGPSYSKE